MIIFGTAEIATLAKFYFENDTNVKPIAFTVDDEYVKEDSLEGLPVIPWSDVLRLEDKPLIHVALSYRGLNKLRQEKYEQVKSAGFTMASYISTKATVWSNDIGDNAFILENNVIQPTVRIGSNVMLWSGNHIGHGTHIADHAYLASHVVISGHCNIGERSFFGVNSTTKDFVNTGSDCFVTMDASITKDIPDHSVVIGRDIIEGEKAQKIKDKYFN